MLHTLYYVYVQYRSFIIIEIYSETQIMEIQDLLNLNKTNLYTTKPN